MSNRQYPIPQPGGAGGAGTVSSVGLADSTGTFTVGGSPVTGSGTLSLSAFANQAVNTFLAGPASGSSAPAAFRALKPADDSNFRGVNAANFGVSGNGYFMFNQLNGTQTGPNIYYLTLSQVSVSGGSATYTGTIVPSSAISNVVETSGSVVTLTVAASGYWQPGLSVQLSGLTTATWLNGQTVTLLAGTTNVSLIFNDPTLHGTQASHAETGAATINFAGYKFTVTGFVNGGNNVQITVTSNTATTLVCATTTQVNETAAANAGGNTIDCNGASFTTRATVGQLVFVTNLPTTGFTFASIVVLPQGTISTINSATQIVVSSTPTSSQGQYLIVWGDDQTTALTNAWNSAVSGPTSGAILQLPASNPLGDGPAVILTQKAQLNVATGTPGTGGSRAGYGAYGGGKMSTYIVPTPNFDFTSAVNNSCFLSCVNGGYFHDFTIWGAGVSNPGSGLSTKTGVAMSAGDNVCWFNLGFIAWGANGTNGIGTGWTITGGEQIAYNIDVDMFGQVACKTLTGSNLGPVDLIECTFWDSATAGLHIANTNGNNPVFTYSCETGNCGIGVAVDAGGVWYDYGFELGLPSGGSTGFNNAILVGFFASGGGTGTIHLNGTVADTPLGAGGHVIYLDNTNCTCTAVGCRFNDQSTKTCLTNNGTFIDGGGNSFASAGTVFSGTGSTFRNPAGKAIVNSTANGANIGSTTLFAVPAGFDGVYRVSTDIIVTTADAVSSTMPSVAIGFTDETSTVQSIAASATSTANTIGTYAISSNTFYAKGGTNITYSTSGYVSNTPGAMKYSLRLRAEWLG